MRVGFSKDYPIVYPCIIGFSPKLFQNSPSSRSDNAALGSSNELKFVNNRQQKYDIPYCGYWNIDRVSSPQPNTKDISSARCRFVINTSLNCRLNSRSLVLHLREISWCVSTSISYFTPRHLLEMPFIITFYQF